VHLIFLRCQKLETSVVTYTVVVYNDDEDMRERGKEVNYVQQVLVTLNVRVTVMKVH